jgi:hypothetical protein
MTPNATVKAWKPDEDVGGTTDADGRYVPGEAPLPYLIDYPCNAQWMVRSEVRDAIDGSVIVEPCRLSLDASRGLFTLGDYVSVTYDDGDVVDRVGEIRRLSRIARGTRTTIIWVQWLKGQA